VVTIPCVTTPTDLELGDDNDNIKKLETHLHGVLRQRGMRGCQVDLCLTQAGELKGLKPSLIARLAEPIFQAECGQRWSVNWRDVWAFSEELAQSVSDVSGWLLPSATLLVNAGRGCFIPESRSFIFKKQCKKGSVFFPGYFPSNARNWSSINDPSRVYRQLSPSLRPFGNPLPRSMDRARVQCPSDSFEAAILVQDLVHHRLSVMCTSRARAPAPH